MTNKARGEISIKLGKKTYIMRPTFHALCSIESQIEKSIIDLLLNIVENKPKISEIHTILKYGMEAYQQTLIHEEDLANLIHETGIVNLLPKVIEFLEYGIGVKK